MTITIEFPPVQPGRLTICWMIAVRSVVLCGAPISPTSVQGSGGHVADADVIARDEMLPRTTANGATLSEASP